MWRLAAWLAPCLACFSTFPACAQPILSTDATSDSISLYDCLKIASQRAPAVLEAKLANEASALDLVAAARSGGPNFRIFGDALVAGHGFYDPVVTNLGQYELKAGMDLPLRDGGTRARNRARARNTANFSALSLGMERRDAAIRAGELAATILSLQRKRQVKTEGIQWLGDLKSFVQAAVSVGERNAGDILRLELERDSQESSRALIETQLGSAQRELRELLGWSGEGAVPLRQLRPGEDPDVGAEDSLAVLRAADRSPEVQSARVSGRQLTLDLEDASSSGALQINASLDAGLAGADLTAWVPGELKANDPQSDFLDRLHRDLGASLRVEFGKSVARRSLKPTVEARRTGVQGGALRTESERAREVRLLHDLWRRWESAHTRRLALDVLVRRSRENLLRCKSLYAGGSLSMLEILDARKLAGDSLEQFEETLAEERMARIGWEVRQ